LDFVASLCKYPAVGAHPGVCLAVMTGPFVPQVLSIKADKISKAVIAGLECEWFGTGNSLHFPSNIA